MKTISKIMLLLIALSFFISYDSLSAGTITINVTEDLSPILDDCVGNTCSVPRGFGAITKMMGEIIKYFTFIAGLGAVLFIVINGILYSMSGMDDSMKTKAKERITKTLMGLLVLLLSGVILNIIAPWIYKL